MTDVVEKIVELYLFNLVSGGVIDVQLNEEMSYIRWKGREEDARHIHKSDRPLDTRKRLRILGTPMSSHFPFW